MALPELFARTRQPLRPEVPFSPEALPGVGTTLDFTMQSQGKPDQWCWTAVTTSLVHHYHSESTLTQCELVNDQFNQSTCCVNGTSTQCNRPASLTNALTDVPILPGTRVTILNDRVDSSLAFGEVSAQIDNDRPLACRVEWDGQPNIGHFVVLFGHSTDFSSAAPVNWVAVADPLYGGSEMPYLKFLTRYRNKGTWKNSYLTQP